MSADVHENLLPGGKVFADGHTASGVPVTPLHSVDYLYLASQGENISGRSTKIQGAFASALAQSDGNGGVGVTSFIGGSPSKTDPTANSQLVSQATWEQTFGYHGTVPVPILLHLTIPKLEVGLIGVEPFRESMSATETAEAKATLETTILHADLTTSHQTNFEFGVRAHEVQDPLPTGGFGNIIQFDKLGVNPNTVSLFDSYKENGTRATVDSVSAFVTLADVQPGDSITFVYQLTAQGTTHGGEHGYLAFLGDPFGQDVISGNLVLSTAAVPEPATGMLSVIALVCIAVVLRGRRAARMS
jgi:hypothetical protein